MSEILENNRKGIVEYDISDWSKITIEGKELTMKLLEKNAEQRITAKEALDHPWFTMEEAVATNLSMAQMNMKKYCNIENFNVEMIKPEFGPIILAPDSDSVGFSSSSPNWDDNIDWKLVEQKYQVFLFIY